MSRRDGNKSIALVAGLPSSYLNDTLEPNILARPAVTGRDVLGNIIEAYEGKELPPLQCNRCKPDEIGCQYYAGTEGNVTLEGNCLTVTPIYVIEGNLDAATGDVDFHGDVLVQGNVFAGVTVKTTGNITVNGHVETANLFAGNDVILKNGMQGSGNGVIRAGLTTQLVIGLDREFKYKMEEIDRMAKEYEDNMTDAMRILERITYQLKNQPATPDLNQQKAEQMRRKIKYQLKLKEISTERERLIDINRRSAEGKIIVGGLANVGCVIIINGVRETLHSEYRDVTFKKSRKEIRIISNRE